MPLFRQASRRRFGKNYQIVTAGKRSGAFSGPWAKGSKIGRLLTWDYAFKLQAKHYRHVTIW